ncbi:MAG TPA: V-type ATP synthase subunit A [Gemmatimonadaceae bacterium]|nr:V-type ATP synthase subunit A [Gemmatimonadaceae bacterium]
MTGGARITRIAGSLVEATPLTGSLYELAFVGTRRLLGEVIRQEGSRATLQVYEDTTGLALGEPVATTGGSLGVTLGPGLLGSVLDGVGRPLARVAAATGDFITPGATAATLDEDARWTFAPRVAAGDTVRAGDVLGTVDEKPGLPHRILVPHGVEGVVRRLEAGAYTVRDAVGELEDGTPLRLSHAWPVRVPRPFHRRLPPSRPFITGQRVFDLLFPVAEGGACIVPGGFGTGKTIVQQSLAKFAEADVVVYVGCGERGNEMTDVLTEFPALIDPRTARPVMDRAVLVVNTSNMPVAAREASIYLGVTIAEYYRDMGYRVALMVDSTSRWAEALREMAARLQEMPGEEGYPTYLASRLGQFMERAGRVQAAGAPERHGAVTIIGAISPPGGDFSEPVTQAALRVAGAMWALDASLAHQRHYPAVDWDTSFSLFASHVRDHFAEAGGSDWDALRAEMVALLQRERELRDIASLVGPDALEDADRLAMDVAALVREVILRQNAFHPNDAVSSVARTYALASVAVALHRAATDALADGVPLARLDLVAPRRALAALRDGDEGDVAALAAAAREALREVAPRTYPPSAPDATPSTRGSVA